MKADLPVTCQQSPALCGDFSTEAGEVSTQSTAPESPSGADIPSFVLSDSPAVVALKQEFRGLDELEQELKREGEAGRERLAAVRTRKAEIAREIFQS
jgi:hypothetical protein